MIFRNDIQGLRAVAFLLVFFFHLNSAWLPGGFLGVDLFFVISGYLITSIIVSDIQKDRFSFWQFYVKRFFRIVPAYLVMILFVTLCGAFIYMYVDMKSLKYYLKNSFFFMSNTVFSNGESYFGAKLSENPLLHTWSLAIEMQFYLLLPMLVYWGRKYLSYIFVFLIVLFLSYSTFQIYGRGQQTEMYFSLWARIPEFLIGGLFGLWFKNGLDLGKVKNNILSVLSLITLLTCSYFITEKTLFPGVLVMLPCLASAMLLVLKSHCLTSIFTNKWMVKIGEYSYSLYLWHWPVMAFIRYKYESYEFTPIQIAIVIVFTILMSWLSYRFVESVFRKVSYKKTLTIISAKGIVALGLIYFLPQLTAQNAIPDYFSKPIMGRSSHYEGKVETMGDTTKNDKILLIGDSNALMLKPFFNQLGRENGFSFRTLTCDAFPALEGVRFEDAEPTQKKMYEWSRSLVAKTKNEVEKADVIFLCAIAYDIKPSVKEAIDHFSTTIRPDQKLVLLNSFPTLDMSPLRLNNSYMKKMNDEFQVWPRTKNSEIIHEIIKGKKNVFFYDIGKSKIFEKAPYKNDSIMYYDKGHLNTFGSLCLAKDLNSDFMQFLNGLREKK
ncbi:acyltransferase family protein [Amniculibacterium sp. G2-70]|uniref:acyltransferase family protein n=1 Tax=Amniculibacterium sp. G2-70 TaxID=2767188 RepID=UPI00165454C8|nr:acyltransferase family protein [Amniculibacterium sp. G2-70]